MDNGKYFYCTGIVNLIVGVAFVILGSLSSKWVTLLGFIYILLSFFNTLAYVKKNKEYVNSAIIPMTVVLDIKEKYKDNKELSVNQLLENIVNDYMSSDDYRLKECHINFVTKLLYEVIQYRYPEVLLDSLILAHQLELGNLSVKELSKVDMDAETVSKRYWIACFDLAIIMCTKNKENNCTAYPNFLKVMITDSKIDVVMGKDISSLDLNLTIPQELM